MTDNEVSDVLKYADQLRDQREIRGDGVVIFQRLVLRFGGAKNGKTIVSVDELAGDGIGRATAYRILNELEKAFLIWREPRYDTSGPRPRRLASRFHIRTKAEVLELSLQQALLDDIAEAAHARESQFETEEVVLLYSNTLPCTPSTPVLTAAELLATLPPIPSISWRQGPSISWNAGRWTGQKKELWNDRWR